MSQTVTVRKVESASDLKALIDFPWTVNKDDPNWTPPLLSMRRELIDQKRHPAWEYMEGDYFMAWRGDQPVGTIAAFINHSHNEFQKENVGWFGAFDVLNDSEAANALLTTAQDWVAAKGCNAIRGPQTFTVHEDVGLLIDGFKPPILLMPYHQPYYRDFIEAQGFTKLMDTYSYYFDWEMARQENVVERLERLANRIMQRGKVHIRPINRKNLRRDFEIFKEVYNRAWVHNWGFVPMTEKELDALIEGLQMIFDPDLACFAEIDGEPIAFAIVAPDFNQVLHAAYAKPNIPEPLTLIKVLWHWKIRPAITGGRVPLMGVVPEHHNKGFDLAMYFYLLKVMREKNYQWVDCGWIMENNHNMRGTLEGFGMKIHRTYRLYEKNLK